MGNYWRGTSTREEFIDRWFERVKGGASYLDAYEDTEKEHMEIFQHNRYKNFDSFLNSYYSAMRNRKSNNL
jgi:hypothetical protein